MPTTTTNSNATTTSQKTIISKILVAIDGSDSSMDAAVYAISIAKKYDAELYALHVIHPADVDLLPGPAQTSAYSLVINTNKESEEYLDKVKLKANEYAITIKTEVIAAINVAEGIVDYAEGKNTDIIVVGTRGKSGIKKALLGSVAANVVTYAHCPVLVIK
jgi:nucleotide-binding universal stress UspA family protein